MQLCTASTSSMQLVFRQLLSLLLLRTLTLDYSNSATALRDSLKRTSLQGR